MSKQYLRLGELLITEGLLTREQLDRALELQKQSPNELLGTIVVKLGFVSEKDLTVALSKQLNIPYISREKGLLTPNKEQDLSKLIPEEFARRNSVLPLSLHHNSLTVALADPLDIVLLDNLRQITGYKIHRVIAERKDIEASINEFYAEGGMLTNVIEETYAAQAMDMTVVEPREQLSLDDLVVSAKKPPVIKLTDLLIRQAIKKRASDIHIEPFYDKISIRLRVDGILQEIPPPDKSMLLPLISRIKILSRMDIAEKRLPQDGSFRATIENRSIDFRVSTIPTIYGEKMAIRILDRSSTPLDLKTLGFSKEELLLFQKAIHKPYGMIFVTGPTGSGKTTTLYAALNELKGVERNITTIEDPVEYQIAGINQVQVKPAIGLTFAHGMRAFLRQDPDIMLIGEVRDLETAQICVTAALTGHLILSTLHTNSAASTITRLINIGVEPFFVASSLALVMAQRLVRKLCPKCKESYKPVAASLPKDVAWESAVIYKPRGCEACGKTGYSGRMAIFEMMSMNQRMERLILQKASTIDIEEEARKSGMSTLTESGYKKVLSGETSLEEILRATLAAEP